jgi:hypothetical protein
VDVKFGYNGLRILVLEVGAEQEDLGLVCFCLMVDVGI